ncbi:hypothetical protein KSP39_PZI005824 [Platanthera zijinensis]|uniref:Importin N-terminal domain-containing protein n=1 Tax=Platanthera zijinensis TaxID=2320716 RepID=A0AAP0BRR1_9ASPA
MSMEFTQILLNAQSIDASARKYAEESLKQFQDLNFPNFLLSLSGELANNEKPVDSRKLAGLVVKNALDAKEQIRKNELAQRWLSLDASVKAQVKGCLLQTLASPALNARSTASQVIAKIAGIELPRQQWPELIRSLLSNIHQLQSHVKQATWLFSLMCVYAMRNFLIAMRNFYQLQFITTSVYAMRNFLIRSALYHALGSLA